MEDVNGRPFRDDERVDGLVIIVGIKVPKRVFERRIVIVLVVVRSLVEVSSYVVDDAPVF